MASFFGFTIGKAKTEDKKKERIVSFTAPQNDDGAMTVAAGGAFGTYMDMEGTALTEMQLITKYRQLSLSPNGDLAVDDVVNECIVVDNNEPPVKIKLDDLDQPDDIKEKITEEFEEVLKLLDFQNQAYDIFRRWYVDGRLYYHKMIDVKKPRGGVQELRYLDPRKIRKIRQPTARSRQGALGQAGEVNEQIEEFFIFNEKGLATNTTEGIKIAKDSISYVHSGIINEQNTMILSNLHKALKPFNQMEYMETALVIYRVSRAPERRIFYIDVGNLPKVKAEQYMRDMMTKHKNKLVYDASTGQIKDDRKFQTMMEDFWLPRREGGKGTEITTLPGGQNLSDIDDIEYFKNNFYRSLNVPISRMESDGGFNVGRSSEITRDELKFNKFVNRLRARFSMLFDDILRTQLLLKGITDKKTWEMMKEDIFYDFKVDNYFSELKDHEIMQERINLLGEVDGYVGRYFSIEHIKRKVLNQTDEEIKEMQTQIDKEGNEGSDEAGEDGKFGAFEGRPDVIDEPPLEELPPENGAAPVAKPKPTPKPAPKTEQFEFTEDELKEIEHSNMILSGVSDE